MRLHVIKMGAKHHWLLLAVHHGVADQISALIMLRDLAAFYNSTITSQRPNLPPLTVQDLDYNAWRQEQEQMGCLEDDRAFWRKQFAAPDSGMDPH